MSFLSILSLTFIVLKLTHVIDWSWWVVLLPLYGGFTLVVGLLTLKETLKEMKRKLR